MDASTFVVAVVGRWTFPDANSTLTERQNAHLVGVC
jgi:hypothetical protein